MNGPGGLVPIAPMQPGVCRVCYQRSVPPADACPSCARFLSTPGFELQSNSTIKVVRNGNEGLLKILPLYLRAHDHSICYSNMWDYKNSKDPSKAEAAKGQINYLVEHALRHESCLTVVFRKSIGRFTTVTSVPSKSQRPGVHPLAQIVRTNVPSRYADLLGLRPGVETSDTSRKISNCFEATRSANADETVLVIDDTLTTGATALSTALALVEAGFAQIGFVALARHQQEVLDARDPQNILIKYLKEMAWHQDCCALCDNREEMFPRPNFSVRYSKQWIESNSG